MKIALPFVMIASVFMFACSNSSLPETNYYLLNIPSMSSESLNSSTFAIDGKKKIQLNVEIAHYLEQPFLVMQTDDNIIYYAHSHMWAEPLKKEVSKSLYYDLIKMNGANIYIQYPDNKTKNTSDYQVNVTIDYFHANLAGKVVLSGTYLWENLDQRQGNNVKIFYFERKLDQDGYAHAVIQMRELLKSLSNEISINVITNKA